MKEIYEKDPWFVEYELSDGARLSRLSFHGYDLLTTVPNDFKSPSNDYGDYETRPVYGYDDCFPSVEVSKYPGLEWTIPDHGELCWLEWKAKVGSDEICFSVESEVLPVVFKRTLQFQDSILTWRFEVQNKSDKALPFQHVNHPLIKLTDIVDLQLPKYKSVNNEVGEVLNLNTPADLNNFIFSRRKGEAHMLYLQRLKENSITWTYLNSLQVKMVFPLDIFSTLGIWWNYEGYPDEDGCRRNECAFEPISGASSKLMDAYKKRLSQWVGANETKSWEIIWILSSRE